MQLDNCSIGDMYFVYEIIIFFYIKLGKNGINFHPVDFYWILHSYTILGWF